MAEYGHIIILSAQMILQSKVRTGEMSFRQSAGEERSV